ncbi:hypothetical protein J1N35_025193 [Gossypium stocksii]|uniref:Uncharacterized protein n=1 Tax=Gossypium stocksii TaxID=47602 RepID=A0A9D3V651_9ROSI|nr:hypothetical protein J1N35_025193 [Gossypium stocksii]
MYDAHNLDQDNPCIIDDHGDNYGEIQLELLTEDHGDELNIVEMIFDPIDIVAELTIKVEVEDELTTKMELKPIFNESLEELMLFLAVVKKVPTEKVDEFYSFSSNKGKKSRVTKSSHNVERRKLVEIIPRKII